MTRTVLLLGLLTAAASLAWYAHSPSPQVAKQAAKANVPSQLSTLDQAAAQEAPSMKSSTARPAVKSPRGGRTAASPNPAAPALREPELELKSAENFPVKGKERKHKKPASGGEAEEDEGGERLSAEGAGPESEGPDAARRREEYFYGQRAYPLGHIPAGARTKALNELDQMIARQQQLGILKGQPQEQLSIGFPGPSTWTLIGPQQITVSGQGANFGNPAATGRVNALAVDPTTPTTVFLGGANGGVWKSTDGGTTWNTNFDQKQSLAIGGIAIAPSDHLTIYVGTGENNFASDSYYGAGVYKSIDGGATWTQQCGPSGVFCAPVGSGRFQGGFTIGEVAVNPSNASIALAAVRNSANSALSGIYRTTDGGANWALIASASGAAGNSVAWSSTDTTKVYATLGQSGSSAAFGVYRSTDSGVTFTKLTGTVPILPSTNLGRHQLAVAPSDGNTVYVAIATPGGGSLNALARTTDGGASWTSFTPSALPNLPDFCSGQCFYDMSLIVSPIDPLTVIVGGSAFTNNSSTVFRTSNGGTSWTDITTGSTAVRPHVDTHAFAFTPTGGRLYTGNDGGAWFTDNPTGTPVTWASANNANLALAQYYPGFSPHPSDENVAFGGTQDNGTQRYGGSLNWPSVTCGDGGFTAIDRNSPTTVYAACQSIDIRRSAFEGTTQSSFFQIRNEIFASGDRTLFIPPLVHDLDNSGRLYFGSFRIWQTMNDGNNWTPISPDLTSGVGSTAVITNIATAEGNPDVVYAVTGDGRVWRTTNAGAGAGATWTNLTKSPLPGRFATSVAVRPGGNPDIVYLTYSGFSGFGDSVGHVFRSTDGGATWTDISGVGAGLLPNVPVNDIAVEHFGAPVNFNGLYIGTDIGVFSSLDDGTTWSPLSTGLPRDAVLSLKLHSDGHLLYAATHGRSAWILQPGDVDPTGLLLLTSISPSSAAAGSGSIAVTLDGNDFGLPSGTPVVLVDGVAAGVVVGTFSATQISATIPASVTASPGVHDISVQQPGHAANPSNPSSSLKFSVTGPQPTLTSLVPNTTATGGPSFDMVVTGTNLVCGGVPSVVRFRTATLAPNGGTCSSTSLTVTVPASQISTSGGVTVRVFNPAPGGGFSGGQTFTVAGPAPSNDNFANAINIGALPFTDTKDSSGATTEVGEPVPANPACTSGQSANTKSIWYKYTPGSSGSVIFNTNGSATDSVIQVVTGSLGSFTAVPGGCADNFSTGTGETVTVSVTGGTTYFIMVSDFNGSGGTTVLNASLPGAPPPNDNFANALNVGTVPFTDTQDTTGATTQAGEPIPSSSTCTSGQSASTKSIWYKYTPGSSGSATFNTNGSAIDSVLQVVTGSLGSFTAVPNGCADIHFAGAGETVTVSVTGGTTYFIMVSDYDGTGGTTVLNLLAGAPAPAASVADLTITKSHTGNFTQGQVGATYTITVTNSGGAATTGTVTVVDTLPTGLTATGLTGTGWTCVVGTLTCTRSDALAAAGSYPAITLTVTVASNAAASVTNSVTVSGGGETNTANDTANDPTTIVQLSDLTIAKSHIGNFNQGQVGATYTITVTNSGTGASSGTVTVVDTLPTGLTATALTGTGWVCVVGTLTCTRSDALAGSASYPAITLTVTVAANAAASVTNSVTVSGGGETNTANDSASDPTTITQLGDLTITKTHTGNFSQGQVGATYTITVTNSGSVATSSGPVISVIDTPPPSLTATALTGTGWTCVLGTLTCTRSDGLAAAASYPAITLTVTVSASAPASVTNGVTVSGAIESNAANNSATDPTTVVATSPDLTITKSHTGNFTQGQVGATYTITATNSGGAATTGTVTVVDTLPTGLTATALTGTGWTCVVGTLTCTRADALAAAGSYPAITLTVTVAGNAAASVTNSVTVSGGGETNTANDSANDSTTINQSSDLTIAKTHTGNFTQGQVGATYTITVTNSGAGVTSGTVTVVDTLPTGLTATGLTGTGWTCVVGTLTCTRADALAAAGSYPAITLTVTVANNAAASVTNNVAVSGGGETNTANDSASDPTTVVQLSDLTIAKTHAGNFTQGQVGATYTITVTNSGPGATSGTVTVVDTLPTGLTATGLAGTGWTCVVGTLTCTRADALAPAGSYPAITLTVTVANNAAASVTNSVAVSGGGELNTANDSATSPTTIIQVADLTIAKSHTGNFTQGQVGATYSITVTNSGAGATSGSVTVVDTLPTGLTATALTGTGWACVVGTLTCTRSDALAAAGSYPAITLTVTVASNAAASVTNSVTVSGGGELNAANDSASDPTTVIPLNPDLTITKTHTGNFTQGQVGATYTITVTNGGAAATTGTVTVVDTLPAGLTATALTGTGWTCVVGTLTCTRADALAAAGSYPAITLTVTVAGSASASVTNSVTVSGGGETNTANDSASDPTTVIAVNPDLTITKTHTGSFTQGQLGATYTITVTNSGGATTSGTVTVVDTLPTGLTATGLTGTGWVCVVGTLTCTRADALAAAGSYPAITLTVTVAGNAAASVTNSATVSGGGELNTANDTANDPTTVIQIPDLTIAKSHTGNFSQGQTGATYTITVSNAGPGATTGTVTVVDTLPAGLTATGLAGTGWACVMGTLTCTRADALAAAGSYPAITLTVTVATNAAASVTNSVTVSGGGETNAANDSASDPTTIVQVSDLTVAKGHTGNFTQGQVGATYTITVSNGGSVATTGTVTAVDTLPTGLTVTGLTGTGWTCVVGTLTCTRADALAAAASYPAITLTVTVANNAAASVTNSVTVSGGGETNIANDTAIDPTTVIQLPDLTIAKSHAGNFTQGQTGATYTITVTNSGSAVTIGLVTIVDTLPTGLTATGLTGTGWTCVVGTLTCTRADALAAAASYPAITLTVTVANNAAASVTNNVTVSGGGETNLANDSASDPTTIALVADLTIAKTHAANFTQGQVGATYTITVSNAGPGPTVGTVTMVDTLPAGLTATALAGTGWTCVVGTLTCTRADALAAAGSYPAITLTVTVSNSVAASVTNSVTIAGGGEINTANDSASDPTTIIQLPDLTIAKTHAGNFTRGLAGQTYTITVSNTGFAPTSGTVTAADTLPAGLTATAITGAGWACVLGTLTCTRADALPVAASYPAITVTVSVATNAGASVTNTVTVSGGGETNVANDSASDPTGIVNPVPTITTISPTHSPAGAAFVLTVNGTNFVNASVVILNGVAKTTTFVSALQLTAALTATDVATGGAFNVSVTNAAPGGGTTANLTLTLDDYSLSGPAAAVTVVAGQSAMYTFTITPSANGFPNAIQFSVSGLPAAATGSFNPPALTPGSANGTTILTVTTKSRTGAFAPPASRPRSPFTRIPLGWFVLLTVILMGLASLALRSPGLVRMRFGRLAVIVVLLLCTGYLAGCVKSGFPEGNQGTPAGTFTLTVTATSGSAQHTTAVTLTVQ